MDALHHVRIAAAAAGAFSSLALAEDGTVFSRGSNFDGQLGLGRSGGFRSPQRVEALSGFTVCSSAAVEIVSCALTVLVELFTWGG